MKLELLFWYNKIAMFSFSPDWLLTLWERLTDRLGLIKLPKRVYRFEDQLAWSLQSQAELEQRPAEQVAADLLTFAIAYRHEAQAKLVNWERLSPREQQVVALVCLRYTYSEIAEQLVISPETVKSHIRNVLRKFKVRSKADLMVILADWDFSAWDQV